MHEPAFWWRTSGLWPRVLAGLMAPLGKLYGRIATRRMANAGTRAALPVLCVGNFTLGGAGKTPTAIMLVKLLQEAGETPFCLTRGYGGSIAGPHLVDAKTDGAAEVGDEALLLARTAPTVVARNRVVGAAFAKAKGASAVVMDDGLQNASLAKDWTIAVIDGQRGIGNACVFPAGPLRAPMAAQLKRCDALLVIGEKDAAQNNTIKDVTTAAAARPIFHGRLAPDPAAVTALKTRKVLAFAGIGNPDKFFATVEQAGIAVHARKAFPDHHRFSAEDAGELIMSAEHDGLTLVTTEKDHARMTGVPVLAALSAKAQVLPVTLVVEESDAIRAIVVEIVKRR